MHDDSNVNEGDQDDSRIQALLKDYPMPQAAAGFFDQALARAVLKGSRRQRSRWVMTGFGGAIAAGLALWVLGDALLGGPGAVSTDATVDAAIPGITMTLEEPRTVNLVFASTTALDAATLTVTLPDGVELAGFPGQKEVSWDTSLVAGRNLLPLRLIALTPVGGELLARLEHENRDRLFRLRLDIS